MSNYEGTQVNSIKEQNEILMSLLKRFYEKKQLKHTTCKSETSNHPHHKTYSLDVFRKKAKKSLSTSFETITSLKISLKNNALENHLNSSLQNSSTLSQTSIQSNRSDDKENNLNFINQEPLNEQAPISSHRKQTKYTTKQQSLPIASILKDQTDINPNKGLFNIFMKIGSQSKSINTSEENLANLGLSSSSLTATPNSNSNSNLNGQKNSDKESINQLPQTNQPSSILKQPNRQLTKQRSLEKTIEFSTSSILFTDCDGQEISIENGEIVDADKQLDGSGQLNDDESEENATQSWRKQIFSSIQANTRHFELNNNEMKSQTKSVTFDSGGDLFKNGTRNRTREELRALWRKAINQQILLIKMEKENLMLKENQHEAEDKRLKLNYEDVISCSNPDQWSQILDRCEEYAQNNLDNELTGTAIKPAEFADAIKIGCPKNRRGEIWSLLADIRKRNGVRPICSPAEASVDFDTNYRVLLQQLTSQQHAILVDLGSSTGAIGQLERKVKNECVQVVVRCRPMSKKELENTSKPYSSKERATKDEIFASEYKQVVDVYPNRGVIEIQNPGDINRENPKMFTYDAVYDQRSTQQDIYDEVVRPLVSSVLEGFNCCVFAS